MDINSLRGISAYANTPTPPVDQTLLQNQNIEASRTELTKESVNAAQEAFKVTITEEAQDKMASETNPGMSETQPAPPADPGTPGAAKANVTSQIVNIVA